MVDQREKYFCGIDIGSATTKTVVLDEQGTLCHWNLLSTGANHRVVLEILLHGIEQGLGCDPLQLAYVVGTGYGRHNIPFAHKQMTEISCHARGSHLFSSGVCTVVDVGGQDSKVIKVDRQGRPIDFKMNEKCAAGTGRFLEVMAKTLGVALEEMGDISLLATRRIEISNTCTVFAESEVISRVAQGYTHEEILAALHQAIARRVVAMADWWREAGEIVMTGGVAKNRGVVNAISQLLDRPVLVPAKPQLIGALGAAMMALENAGHPPLKNRPLGWDAEGR